MADAHSTRFGTRHKWFETKSPEAKRLNAEVMAELRAARTDEQQLERLDKMLGKGQGAKKERARLNARIEATKQKATAKPKTDKAKKQ